jgi:hypothetical protein
MIMGYGTPDYLVYIGPSSTMKAFVSSTVS